MTSTIITETKGNMNKMNSFKTGKAGHEENYELTTASPLSHYGIPVLRVRSHDGFADGDYGPADQLSRAGSTAAFLVHVAAEQWGVLDKTLAKSFLSQWPEGPQMHRNFTITTGRYGLNVESINCFGCRSVEQAMHLIDIYIDGNKNPQCYGK